MQDTAFQPFGPTYAVSGTPVQVRTTTVTVRATDSVGNVVTTVYTYTVTS